MKTSFNTIVFSSALMLATTSGQQIRGGSKKLDPAIAVLPPSMNSERRNGLGRETQEVWWDPAAANTGVVENEKSAVEGEIEAYAIAVEEEAEDKLKQYTATLVADMPVDGAADGTAKATEITNLSEPASPVEGEVVPTAQEPPSDPNAQGAPAAPVQAAPEAGAGDAAAKPVNAAPEAAAGDAQAAPVNAAPEAATGDAQAAPVQAAPEAAAGDAPVNAAPEAVAGDAPADPVQATPDAPAESVDEKQEYSSADADAEEEKAPKDMAMADEAEGKKAPKDIAMVDEVEEKMAPKEIAMADAGELERGQRPAPKGGLSHVFEDVPEAPELGIDTPLEALPVAEESAGKKNKAKKTQGGSADIDQAEGSRGGMNGAAVAAKEGGMTRNKNPEDMEAEEAAGPRGGGMAPQEVNAQSIEGGGGGGMRRRRMMAGGGGGGGGDNASVRKLLIQEYLDGQVKSRGQNRPYYHGSK